MPYVIATKYNLFRTVTVAGAALVNLLNWAGSVGSRSAIPTRSCSCVAAALFSTAVVSVGALAVLAGVGVLVGSSWLCADIR
jgi:hypothetical protein